MPRKISRSHTNDVTRLMEYFRCGVARQRVHERVQRADSGSDSVFSSIYTRSFTHCYNFLRSHYKEARSSILR